MKYLIYIVKRDIPKFEIAGSAVDIPREDTSLQHFSFKFYVLLQGSSEISVFRKTGLIGLISNATRQSRNVKNCQFKLKTSVVSSTTFIL